MIIVHHTGRHMADTDAQRLFSIGEFSRVTGITVKGLRFYHEERLLSPVVVDADTGYRYYDPAQIEQARAIVLLRELDVPLEQIRTLLAVQDSDERVADVLKRHKATLEMRIKKNKEAVRRLQEFLAPERTVISMSTEEPQVAEKMLEPLAVAGIRTRGRYGDCGKLFGKLSRSVRRPGGSPMMLHYETEYRESDADFEACIPLRSGVSALPQREGMAVHTLPGGRCVFLVHHGPYEQLGNSYQKVFSYVKERGYRPQLPSRELFLKGPGMIFRGNPRKYVTEIQVLVE